MRSAIPKILHRLEEYQEKAAYEVDIDVDEILSLNNKIVADKNLTQDQAEQIHDCIIHLNVFVEGQRESVLRILNGMSSAKKAISQYSPPTLKSKSRFVYRKA